MIDDAYENKNDTQRDFSASVCVLFRERHTYSVRWRRKDDLPLTYEKIGAIRTRCLGHQSFPSSMHHSFETAVFLEIMVYLISHSAISFGEA